MVFRFVIYSLLFKYKLEFTNISLAINSYVKLLSNALELHADIFKLLSVQVYFNHIHIHDLIVDNNAIVDVCGKKFDLHDEIQINKLSAMFESKTDKPDFDIQSGLFESESKIDMTFINQSIMCYANKIQKNQQTLSKKQSGKHEQKHILPKKSANELKKEIEIIDKKLNIVSDELNIESEKLSEMISTFNDENNEYTTSKKLSDAAISKFLSAKESTYESVFKNWKEHCNCDLNKIPVLFAAEFIVLLYMDGKDLQGNDVRPRMLDTDDEFKLFTLLYNILCDKDCDCEESDTEYICGFIDFLPTDFHPETCESIMETLNINDNLNPRTIECRYE